jgi:seryl-tRNA synthetase
MENYYDPADGGVFIPQVLKPYMNNLEKLMPLGQNKGNEQKTA